MIKIRMSRDMNSFFKALYFICKIMIFCMFFLSLHLVSFEFLKRSEVFEKVRCGGPITDEFCTNEPCSKVGHWDGLCLKVNLFRFLPGIIFGAGILGLFKSFRKGRNIFVKVAMIIVVVFTGCIVLMYAIPAMLMPFYDYLIALILMFGLGCFYELVIEKLLAKG